MRDFKEKLSQKETFQFSICLWCGHIQRTEYSDCEKCEAGKIGLGKPRTLWAYLDIKVEMRMLTPERLMIEDVVKELLWRTGPGGLFKLNPSFKERLESVQSVLNQKDESPSTP